MNKVLCIKPAQGLEVGKTYDVEFDLYDLIHVNGQGYGRDKFEYVQGSKPVMEEQRPRRTFARDRAPKYLRG